MKSNNLLKIFIFMMSLLFLNTVFADDVNDSNTDNSNNLNFSAMQSKYIDVDINIEIPVYVSNYNEHSTLTFKTPIFYNSRTQKADFEAFYLDDSNNKVFANIDEDDYGNKIAIFEINEVTRDEYIFNIQGNIISENKIVLNTADYNLNNPIEEHNEFLEDTTYIKTNSSEIISLANTIKSSDLAIPEIVNISNWINHNIEYDMSYADTVEDALEVLENKKGVCDEMAILTASILRAKGIPTKYVVGVANTSTEWGPHAWLEVFVPHQGWIPLDATYNEVGLVDSSHIILAKVKDPTESSDKITATSGVDIRFGQKKVSYNINDKKSFADLGYNNYLDFTVSGVEKLKPQSTFKITGKVKNTTANPIAILTTLNTHETFKLIYPKSTKTVVYLEPFEEKKMDYYYILPSVDRAMYYGYILSSQIGSVEDRVIIDPNYSVFEDAFFVLDPFIYFENEKLAIDIKIINYTNESKQLDLELDVGGQKINDTIEVEASQEMVFTKKLPTKIETETDILFTISNDYDYSKTIHILPDLKIEVEDNNIVDSGDVVDNNSLDNGQNIDVNTSDIWDKIDSNKIQEKTKPNYTILIVMGIVLLVVIILLVFSKRK